MQRCYESLWPQGAAILEDGALEHGQGMKDKPPAKSKKTDKPDKPVPSETPEAKKARMNAAADAFIARHELHPSVWDDGMKE